MHQAESWSGDQTIEEPERVVALLILKIEQESLVRDVKVRAALAATAMKWRASGSWEKGPAGVGMTALDDGGGCPGWWYRVHL